MFISPDFSDRIANIYAAHSSRFEKLLNILQEATVQYLDSVKVVDGKSMCEFSDYYFDDCFR